MVGREPSSLRSCALKWLGEDADDHIEYLRRIGGAWTSAPDDAEIDPALSSFSDSWITLQFFEEIFQEACDSGHLRPFGPRRRTDITEAFLMSAHRDTKSEADLVRFQFAANHFPVRPLRQLQWAVLDRVRGGLPHDEWIVESERFSSAGPVLIESWQRRLSEVLAAGDHDIASALLGLHWAVKLHRPGEQRSAVVKELRRLWLTLGEEIGLIPRFQGGVRISIATDALHDLYMAGVSLAQMARQYDPSPDRETLAEIEHDPPEGIELWARLFRVGAVFSLAELNVLLRPLPGAIPGHPAPSVGIHVVSVLAERLRVEPTWVANKLDLGSVKPYVKTS